MLIITLGLHYSAEAQRRKRPPKQENQQTPESAIEKKKEQDAKQMAAYQQRIKRHQSVQDKPTRKRMKRNEKYAQKLSTGKTTPWYKRVFRKKRKL
jgi:hypothetical protein